MMFNVYGALGFPKDSVFWFSSPLLIICNNFTPCVCCSSSIWAVPPPLLAWIALLCSMHPTLITIDHSLIPRLLSRCLFFQNLFVSNFFRVLTWIVAAYFAIDFTTVSGLGIMAKKFIDQDDCKVAEFMYEVCKNSPKEHTSNAVHQDNG